MRVVLARALNTMPRAVKKSQPRFAKKGTSRTCSNLCISTAARTSKGRGSEKTEAIGMEESAGWLRFLFLQKRRWARIKAAPALQVASQF